MTVQKEAVAASPTISAPGVSRWSTDDVPQPQRLDYWIGAVCEGFEEVVLSGALRAEFRASLEAAYCGQIAVSKADGSAQTLTRTRGAISRSVDSSFYLVCKLDAPCEAGQDEGLTRLLPGDCMLFDSTRPYKLHSAGSADAMTLQLPVKWVESWLTNPEALCGLRIDGGAGWGRPLSSFIQQFTPQMAGAPPLPAKLMTDQLGSLLALSTNAFATDRDDSSRAIASFVRKATECVQERHTEFGLTAQVIAQELHISERTLHRYFAQSGATFLQHLMRHRMTVAERMLRDPRFDRLTVSEVGRRVGLADTSHFIRQCKGATGVTPAALRRAR